MHVSIVLSDVNEEKDSVRNLEVRSMRLKELDLQYLPDAVYRLAEKLLEDILLEGLGSRRSTIPFHKVKDK